MRPSNDNFKKMILDKFVTAVERDAMLLYSNETILKKNIKDVKRPSYMLV